MVHATMPTMWQNTRLKRLSSKMPSQLALNVFLLTATGVNLVSPEIYLLTCKLNDLKLFRGPTPHRTKGGILSIFVRRLHQTLLKTIITPIIVA